MSPLELYELAKTIKTVLKDRVKWKAEDVFDLALNLGLAGLRQKVTYNNLLHTFSWEIDWDMPGHRGRWAVSYFVSEGQAHYVLIGMDQAKLRQEVGATA